MISDYLNATNKIYPGTTKAELNLPYAVCEIVVAVCAVLGNGLVIIVFSREKKLRRRTNYYIISLASADLMVGLFAIPFAILASIGLPTNFYACLFTVSVLVVLCTISIFCLVAVSIDRYWAILYPMGYSRNVRTKTAIAIICVCWITGTLVGFLPLLGWNAGFKKTDEKCIFVEVMDYNYLVFLYFATIIFPAFLIAAFYAHIYRVVIQQQLMSRKPINIEGKRRKRKGNNNNNEPSSGTMLRLLGAAQKREVKATQNLSRIVIFFIICWFPLYTINCVQAFCPDCTVSEFVLNATIILSHLNSVGNPILYAYHLKDFRAALKNFILRILNPGRCRRDNNAMGMNEIQNKIISQRNLAKKSLNTAVKHTNSNLSGKGVTLALPEPNNIDSSPSSTPTFNRSPTICIKYEFPEEDVGYADESLSSNVKTSDNSENYNNSNNYDLIEDSRDFKDDSVLQLREHQITIEESQLKEIE